MAQYPLCHMRLDPTCRICRLSWYFHFGTEHRRRRRRFLRYRKVDFEKNQERTAVGDCRNLLWTRSIGHDCFLDSMEEKLCMGFQSCFHGTFLPNNLLMYCLMLRRFVAWNSTQSRRTPFHNRKRLHGAKQTMVHHSSCISHCRRCLLRRMRCSFPGILKLDAGTRQAKA